MQCFHSFTLPYFSSARATSGTISSAKGLRVGRSRGGCSASYLPGKAFGLSSLISHFDNMSSVGHVQRVSAGVSARPKSIDAEGAGQQTCRFESIRLEHVCVIVVANSLTTSSLIDLKLESYRPRTQGPGFWARPSGPWNDGHNVHSFLR